MTFPFIRFLPWALMFGLGVVVGAIAAPGRDSQSAALVITPTATQKMSAADWPATSPAAGLPEGFEQRLYAHIDSAVADAIANQLSQASATTTTAKGASNMALTENQRQTFEMLRTRLTNHSLTWSQLISAPELSQLPQAWRERIFSQAAEMLTRGELVPAQFIDVH